MRNKERLRVAGARKRRDFLCHQVGGLPGDFSPDARPLAGKDGELPLGDFLLGVDLTGGAHSLYAVDFEGKIRRVIDLRIHFHSPFSKVHVTMERSVWPSGVHKLIYIKRRLDMPAHTLEYRSFLKAVRVPRE